MRLIARIDVKNEYVIKGIHLEGLRKIGDPNEIAVKYYAQGVDEIVFMDAVASLYDRNNLFHIIRKACEDVFVPITLGGGIRTIEDITSALQSGADKVAINTAAIKNPSFISEASEKFGSQCIIGSIEAKKQGEKWEAYVDNGRERTGIDAIEWAKELQKLGTGEILITSVDREGTKKGFETELVEKINAAVSIPVIVSGGLGELKHINELWDVTKPSAIAMASVLHYGVYKCPEIKKFLEENGIQSSI